MSLVTLVSGGIDSTLMSILAKEEGISIFPLFIDYGQLCLEREWRAARFTHQKHGLPNPVLVNLSGYGRLISSGLTNPAVRVNEDAFLPGRNLLFLLVGCAYAYQVKADAVAIGLLDEAARLFPDQSLVFVENAQRLVRESMNYSVSIVTPLAHLSKREVLGLAKEKGIVDSYSCHAGTDPPCGVCVSCEEVRMAQSEEK